MKTVAGISSRWRRFILTALAVCVTAAFAGCHHPYDRVPEIHAEPWTPSEIENMLGGSDPLEGFNRSMFSCTHFLMSYVADPLGRVYTTIFPRPFIKHFNNLCVNLEYPARLFSSLLQAEWQAAGTETLRFLANTTLGIAGIFDVALAWWNIPPAEADFGQAFARWGIGPGETLILPLLPAVNGRDLTGTLFDTAFDIKTYIPYAGYATFLNRMVIAQHGYDQIVNDSLDPYKNYRQMMLLRRELQLQMWFYRESRRQIAEFRAKSGLPPEPPARSVAALPPPWLRGNYSGLQNFLPQASVTDSMRSVLFQPRKTDDFWYMPLSLFNSDFLQQAYLREVELVPGRSELHYAFWKPGEAPENAPAPPEKLVILLPGIGGTCTAGTLVALAEKFHDDGFAVLGVDSTFSWRFSAADGNGLPGFLPDDAKRTRNALLAVLADLHRRQWIKAPRIVLCGYSMGGMQTLKLAELESASPQLKIDRFIAINPPVSTRYAMEQIDRLNASSANWSKSELHRRMISAAGNMMLRLSGKFPPFDPDSAAAAPEKYRMPLDEKSAAYIVGLSLKLPMRELLLVNHREKPLAGFTPYRWGKRNKLYLEIDRLDFAAYTRLLQQSRYSDRQLTELLAASDLRSLESELRRNPAIRVFHNVDDFLLSDADRKFLDRSCGEKIHWFSNGGHLGSLYYRSVAEKIVSSAR